MHQLSGDRLGQVWFESDLQLHYIKGFAIWSSYSLAIMAIQVLLSLLLQLSVKFNGEFNISYLLLFRISLITSMLMRACRICDLSVTSNLSQLTPILYTYPPPNDLAL